MADRTELFNEIDKLPTHYLEKLHDFVFYLQQIARNDYAEEIAEYQAMAADAEREQEACEWCHAYIGP